MSDIYRPKPAAEDTTEIARTTVRDFDLVLFDGNCPWCGSPARLEINYHYRTLVRARTWSFLWWRSHPAYFRVKCGGCRTEFRELTKGAP